MTAPIRKQSYNCENQWLRDAVGCRVGPVNMEDVDAILTKKKQKENQIYDCV